MKKTVLSLAVASLVLAGCGSNSKELSKKTNDGKDVIASIGSEYIYADDVNNTTVMGTDAANKSIYEQVTKLLTQTAYPITSDIKASAEVKVEQFKTTAEETAAANGTKYEDELETALNTLGVDSIKDLQKYYEYELQKAKLSDKYWNEKEEEYYNDYVDNALPYHLSHTLVQVGATDMYFLDTISAEYAKEIGNVIKDLKNGRTFDFVAQNYSDDGSASKGGDLGLMDVNTAFVSEFKYSVYMLDYYTQLTKNANFFASTSEIYQNTVKELKKSTFYANGLNQIPMSKAELLLSAADKTTYNVNNYSYTRTYTRNIIFNNYFNQPGASVIVFDDATKLIEDTVVDGKIVAYGNYVELKTSDNAEPVKVLASGGKVVMAVRSVSLDSSSGIHFITIDQSPLADNAKTYFANDTEKDEDGNYVNNTYISFYGEDAEKTSKETLESAVKTYIESGQDTTEEVLAAEMFEHFYAEKAEEITLADGIKEIVEGYISFLKADHEKAFLNSFEKTRDAYVKLLNTYSSFKNDHHFIPAACIDENGDPLYVTINGAKVKACIRETGENGEDGRWVVRSSDATPTVYSISTTVVTGVTVDDDNKEVNEGAAGTVVLTLGSDYTLTEEAGKTALVLSIDGEVYTIDDTNVEDLTVTVNGSTVTLTFNNVSKNHTIEVSTGSAE